MIQYQISREDVKNGTFNVDVLNTPTSNETVQILEHATELIELLNQLIQE